MPAPVRSSGAAEPAKLPAAVPVNPVAEAPTAAEWAARYVRPCAKSGNRLVC